MCTCKVCSANNPEGTPNSIAMVRILSLFLLILAGGCAQTSVKSYGVEVRIPNLHANFPLVRTRLVLVGIDALSERNLSRSEEYQFKSKTPLVSVLLRTAAERMRAAGIEPLETTEAEHASGRIVISLTLLENRSSTSTDLSFLPTSIAKHSQVNSSWLRRVGHLLPRESSFSQRRPRLDCLAGTFRPSWRQIRSTRL